MIRCILISTLLIWVQCHSDFDEFLYLLPKERIIDILNEYEQKPKIQEFFLNLRNDPFLMMLNEIETMPEVVSLVTYLRINHVDVDQLIQGVHEFLGVSQGDIRVRKPRASDPRSRSKVSNYIPRKRHQNKWPMTRKNQSPGQQQPRKMWVLKKLPSDYARYYNFPRRQRHQPGPGPNSYSINKLARQKRNIDNESAMHDFIKAILDALPVEQFIKKWNEKVETSDFFAGFSAFIPPIKMKLLLINSFREFLENTFQQPENYKRILEIISRLQFHRMQEIVKDSNENSSQLGY